jgi:hypothetical protein
LIERTIRIGEEKLTVRLGFRSSPARSDPGGWMLPTMPGVLVVTKVRTRFSLTREVRWW